MFLGLPCRDVKLCLALACLVQGVNMARNTVWATLFKSWFLTLVFFHSDEGVLFFFSLVRNGIEWLVEL